MTELCHCAVLWLAHSRDQVSLGGRVVFSVRLLWPVLLKGWQERSADVAAPVCSKDLGCPCVSQASLCHPQPIRNRVWTQDPQDVLVCGEPAGL